MGWAASITLAVTSAIIYIWIVQFLYNGLTSSLRRVPGPWYTKFTRLPLKLTIITGERVNYVHQLHLKYGPVVRISPDEVAVSSYAEVREIHRAGSPFLKGDWYEKVSNPISIGVLAEKDPKKHAQKRKMFARSFTKMELRRNWEFVVKEKAKLAVQRIRQDLESSNGVADMYKWWYLFSTDTVAHLMFGESFEMLQFGKKNKYIEFLQSSITGLAINVELPIFGMIAPYIPLSAFQTMFRANDYILEYGHKAVENAKRVGNSTAIFTEMINESKKQHSKVTDADVSIESGNLIVAGSDSTAITLTYLIWAILSRPTLQKQIEDEVAQLTDGYDDITVEYLPLLNAVMMESLRLYSSTQGGLPRVVPKSGATFRGFFIPGGTTVSTQSYTIHRDPSLFVDPLVFDHTRWMHARFGEKENPRAVTMEGRLIFAPFGMGPRICIGMYLAWMELRMATVEFFRQCRGARLAPSTTPESMQPLNFFINVPKAGKCEITMERQPLF
ncbi:sterigmatocystin biosynthesis P450 monooxygenase [Talaromyces proteolyticus]|uniref:Sterigmatocystin biosynthesis P450 monooxygenase n=1 Tax=Talaromyces proteolyticus TaxID=1131652 RepID=A0AAD4KFS6_9EURO|nr:sterigmatocystin biosynthesis P450 monooxygenase [Talaromyces proteolyticus]KAH8690113.1 sterigmatocystin biosynthesis P450 monooxygenase [Talaromyces proteolyticus]